MFWILNILKELWDIFFIQRDGIKQVYLVGNQGRKLITVDELKKPYDHVEIEFVYDNKTFVHVLSGFHNLHGSPVILSAILNDYLDITDYVNQYLMNDLSYLQVKHVIPPKYLSTFETLEILDEDCNSLIYRNLESSLDFLEHPEIRERRNSCNVLHF